MTARVAHLAMRCATLVETNKLSFSLVQSVWFAVVAKISQKLFVTFLTPLSVAVYCRPTPRAADPASGRANPGSHSHC